jgi:myo-inositol-1(or 4)-monophosphatase
LPAADLPLLVEAARAAGRIAARFWRQRPRAWDKPGEGGPVSEADIEVNRMLRARLTAARPDYGWLSEESEDTPARLAARRVFIVDPIDGTRAFLAGERGFSHAIAVADEGRITAAVVFLPMSDRLYAAAAGQGATLNGVPLAASRRADPEGARLFASASTLDPRHWRGGAPAVERYFRAALAHRLCLVAEGAADALLTLRPAWEWDVAAGALIAAEAGAVTTGARGEPLLFNAAVPLCPGVLAAPPLLHEALLARMRPAAAS